MRTIFEGKDEANNREIVLYSNENGANEFYVEGVHGVLQSEMSIKMNFYTTSVDSNKEKHIRESACRLVMTNDRFLEFVGFMNSYAEELRKLAQPQEEK